MTSTFELIIHTIVNIAIALFFIQPISILSLRAREKTNDLVFNLIIGLSFGLVSGVIVYSTVNITQSLGLEFNFILITLTTIFIGPIAGLTAAVFTIIFSILQINYLSIPTVLLNVVFAYSIGIFLVNFIRKEEKKRLWVIPIMMLIFVISTYFFLEPAIINRFKIARFVIVTGIQYITTTFLLIHIYENGENRIKNLKTKKEKILELERKNEELSGLYEQITATEEELRANYLELVISREAIVDRENRIQKLMSISRDGFFEFDLETNRLILSPMFTEMFGYDENEAIHFLKNTDDYVLPEHIQIIKNAKQQLQKNLDHSNDAEFQLRTKSGEYRWVRYNWFADYDSNGDYKHVTGKFTDIHEKKLYEEELYRSAYTDNLTKLPNKHAFDQTLNKILNTCSRNENTNGKCGAIAFLDLDNFKVLNDSFGHSFGDKLLINISKQLNKIVTDDIFLARFGGDEFVLILNNLTEEKEIQTILGKFQELFSQPISINNTEVNIQFSVGVVQYPLNGSTVDELLKHVDTALNEAKVSGKNKFLFFNPSMADMAKSRMSLEQNMRKALRLKKFKVVYQPQYNIRSNEMIGVEALLRWWNPELGHVSPGEFIPLAEESGLIYELGNFVINESCKFAKKVNKNSDIPITVSVNISTKQIQSTTFVDDMLKIIKEHDVDPKWFTLEITESALMQSFRDTIQKVTQLMEYGFKIALDDFGVGYSSLNYLLSIPTNIIKIDRTFIDNMANSEKHIRLVRSIIDIAHDLNMHVVAEGVETEEQLGILKQFNCDYLQGYLFSKPLPEEDFFKLSNLSN